MLYLCHFNSQTMARHIACLFVIFLFIKGYSCAITAKDIQAKEGEEVILKCQLAKQTNKGIKSCTIKMQGLDAFELADESIAAEVIVPVDQKNFSSTGICQGKLRIKEQYNGIATCSIRADGQATYQSTNFTITVLRAPRSPELFYDTTRKEQLDATVGQKVIFTCKSPQGRPAASLKWFINDTQQISGLSRVQIEDLPNDLHTVSQNLTLTIDKSLHMKFVKCIASHPAVPEDQKKEIYINVLFAPKSEEDDPKRVYGLTEGQETTIGIIVESNPQPLCQWSVNGTQLLRGAGGISKYIPAIRRAEGSNNYNVTLKITSVEKSDDYIRISVNCTNPAISQSSYIHHFEISTKEGPPAFSTGLGINAILGIIVGVLIILLVALLLVYARLKGRWCFAGKTAAQTAGREPSDTESAEQQQKAKKAKKEKINFKALFRKSAPSESKEAEKSSDPLNPKTEKTDDAIVYAELDLKPSSTQPAKPATQPPEDKTEYAEIIATKK